MDLRGTRCERLDRTVKDICAGSGVAVRGRGAAALVGIPGEWRLVVVEKAT